MQKKFTLILLSCLCSFLCFGQIKKGTITTQFKLEDLNSIRLKNSNNLKNTNLSFTPGIGYFVKDNWEIGVGFNYNIFRYRFNGVAGLYHQQSNSVGIKVYSNYYFGKGKLNPYVTFQTGWQYTDGYYIETGTKTGFSNDHLYIGSGVGINYQLSNKVSLFSEASYQRNSPFKNYSSGRLNVSAGIRIFFNQKKNAN